MKKKGFTLVELLAVIVILAVIAVIAVPIIIGIIKDAKYKAAVESLKGYLDAAEKTITLNELKQEANFPEADNNGCYNLKELDKKIEAKGNRPTGIKDSDKMCFKDGNVKDMDKVIIDGYEAEVKDYKLYVGDKEVKEETSSSSLATNLSGKSCVTNGICSKTDIINGGQGLAINVKVNNNEIKKFYVINDDGTNVDLILDRNTTEQIDWNTNGSNATGPSTAFLNQLKADTNIWTNINNRVDTYNLNNGTANYTINYNGYRARLISAEEVANIIDNTSWKEKNNSTYFYFDTKTTTSSTTCKQDSVTDCKYGWLYDRTLRTCTNFGCLNNSEGVTYGYWTSTAKFNNNEQAWSVRYNSVIYGIVVNNSTSNNGIRPVITIPKNEIN